MESVPKLAGFGINTKADAIGLFKKMKFGPKDMIVKEGDVSVCCYLIYSGDALLKNKSNSHLNYGYIYQQPLQGH